MHTATLTLPALAAFILRDGLGLPGWATTPRDFAGALPLLDKLENLVPAFPEELKKCTTQAAALKANAAWCRAEIPVECSTREREAAAKCVRHLIEKGILPVGFATAALLSALEIE